MLHTDALIARFVALHIMCSLTTSTKIIPTFCFCTERMHTLLIENTFFVYTGSHWSARNELHCQLFVFNFILLFFFYIVYLYNTFVAYSRLLSCIHLDKHRDHFRSVLNYVHKMHRSDNHCLICRCCCFLKLNQIVKLVTFLPMWDGQDCVKNSENLYQNRASPSFLCYLLYRLFEWLKVSYKTVGLSITKRNNRIEKLNNFQSEFLSHFVRAYRYTV